MKTPDPSKPLGYAPMDAVHAEFDTLVAQALACPDDRLHACLARLQEHLLSHFGQEDDWMRQTAFPAGDCHIEEHGKVLASGVQVLDLVAQGNLAIGRDFAAELERWFPGHADYLDSALAASWLKSCFSAAGQGKSGDSFWVDSAVTLCQNALNILQFTRSSYSLFGLYQCLFQSEKMNAAIDEVLADLEKLTSRDQAQVAESLEWLKSVWDSNDEKLKQNVLATASTVLSPFANIDLREGFCTASPDAFQMADLLAQPTTLFVNLPMAKYGKAGASLTYLLIKLSFMNLMRSRRANRDWNQTRPVVFLCDEYQAIVDPISDLDFWDKSRSSKTIGIVSMQGVSSLYAALGNNRPVADAILQNFRNRWLFKSEDLETVQQTVKLLGQHDIELESQSQSAGESYGYQDGELISGGWQQTGYSSGTNTSVSIQREDILSASDLRALPKFHALFIGSAGDGDSFEDVFNLTPIFVD